MGKFLFVDFFYLEVLHNILMNNFPSFTLTDSMGSDFEEEEEEEDPIKPPLSLAHLATNGPESVGHLGASELSLQSMSTDSKNNDDSDQVRNPKI
jgi:hypothetical protein